MGLRRTHGRYVTLAEEGRVPEPGRLVAEADAFLESAAARIDQEPPKMRLLWARANLLGQHGRAMRHVAICDADDDDPTSLRRLDKHELSHALITMLSTPEHYPPMLLVEGWAEALSRNPNELDSRFRDAIDRGEVYTLDQLTGPGWYSSGRKTVYYYGGVLVEYLLAEFGGERFFALYSTTDRRSFEADVQRLFGINLDQLEANLWWSRGFTNAPIPDRE